MGGQPLTGPDRTLGRVDTTLRDPIVGRLVDGRYLVESRIERGGMATVYLALDRRLDRDVALKVMHEHLAGDPEFVARFIREARSAARLSHPNVVQVFDQGSDTTQEVGAPLLYLAMEYLPGRTLRDVLAERGALTPREAFSVFEPVLDALSAAHRAGIVHRDVKPENVILTDDGRIKVADFGLARAGASQSGAPGGALVIGTVGYLAPEMVSRGVADARADVYAAGIMLFEMITGRQPYTGGDPVEIAYRHVHETVPAPSTLVPGLPASFDTLVTTATAHNPDDRPPSAERYLALTRAAHREFPEDRLDTRASHSNSAEVSHTETFQRTGRHQQTRALTLPGEPEPPAPSGTAMIGDRLGLSVERGIAVRPDGPLVPRLRVHEDDEALDNGTLQNLRRRRGLTALIAVVGLALLLVLAGWWYAAGPGAYTSVPGVTGARLADANRELAARGLHGKVEQIFSSTVAAGQVVTTDPPGGGKVKKNGTVLLRVSKGPELVTVPMLKGRTVSEATAALEAIGLKVGEQTKQYADDVPEGRIVSSAPAAGQQIAPGREIAVVVSKGPEPTVTLVTLVGQNREQALQWVQANGLVADVTDVDPGVFLPQNTVLTQDPAPNTVVHPGDHVKLSITRNLEGGTGPMVPVPDVTGQNFKDAEKILHDAGFQVDRQRFGVGNRVIGQSPSGGSQAAQGSTVTLRTF